MEISASEHHLHDMLMELSKLVRLQMIRKREMKADASLRDGRAAVATNRRARKQTYIAYRDTESKGWVQYDRDTVLLWVTNNDSRTARNRQQQLLNFPTLHDPLRLFH
jgi:hypothetical protein